MKTKEFIRKVGELGFKAHKGVMQIDIVSDGLTVAIVSTKRIHVINSFCFVDVEWKNQDKLFDLIVEYAKTPIEERKEEKYYLVKFSEKEIEEIKKKFDTDLKDFELIEVEE